MEKCIVKGCLNHRHQGRFIGDLCSPCHAMLTEGKYIPSSAWFALEGRRAQRAEVDATLAEYLEAWRKLPEVPGYVKASFDIWLGQQLERAQASGPMGS
ncbi:hypothetical protein [Burkholderia ubonensis]|uniref:hypothetical protein n=1 Tax=Burkholderia ubonensis TaxID=101571 RepID=UPI000B1A2D9B|nr:hypothetical protein [Burkholderia ubonensis]